MKEKRKRLVGALTTEFALATNDDVSNLSYDSCSIFNMTNLLNQKITPFESTDISRTYPEWRSPLLSADCVYIQIFEELDQGRIKLAEKEMEAKFFNAEMKTKWERLRKQQLSFLADIQKYDQFFSENERKFRRVSAKISTELVVQKDHELDIETYEKRNEYLLNIMLKMEKSINILTPYHTFVNTLVTDERATEYDLKDVESLVNLILSISQNKLHKEFSSALFEFENLHSQMEQYKKIKESVFSKQTSDLFRTKKLLSNEKKNLMLFQNELDKRLKGKNEESMLMTHHNIYRLLCEWKKTIRPLKSENNDEEISYISNTIGELRCIVKRAEEIFNKSNLSNEVNSSFITLQRL